MTLKSHVRPGIEYRDGSRTPRITLLKGGSERIKGRLKKRIVKITDLQA